MTNAAEASAGIVQTQFHTFAHPPHALELECGGQLGPVTLAYETYGDLDSRRANAILVLHGLSGDAHAAGLNAAQDRKPGWWDTMIGPGKPLDTNRYFVICSNVIGGCKGSTGPCSHDPATGRPYGLRFPIVTIGDMVRAQAELVGHLGIETLLAVVGGSMGGMQALQWAVSYPDRARLVAPIATTAKLSAQSIAFNEVGRQAILSDPNWNGGDYYDGESPAKGLALARMIAHITYLSDESMHEKFGRRLQDRSSYSYGFKTDFQVESYLRHQGDRFVERFDANSYLYITKAMDYFDLSQGGSLREVLAQVRSRFLILSFTSDWLFPSYQSKEIVTALRRNDKDVSYAEIASRYGHDAFLLETGEIGRILGSFLSHGYQQAISQTV